MVRSFALSLMNYATLCCIEIKIISHGSKYHQFNDKLKWTKVNRGLHPQLIGKNLVLLNWVTASHWKYGLIPIRDTYPLTIFDKWMYPKQRSHSLFYWPWAVRADYSNIKSGSYKWLLWTDRTKRNGSSMIIPQNSEMITKSKQRIFELFIELFYLIVFRKILKSISCFHLQLVFFF